MARPTTMEADKAAAILEQALSGIGKRAELTIADAAAKAGISLREAEAGLHALSSKYRGTLSVTDDGELLFRFPYGFSLPLTKRPWFARAVDRVQRAVVGAGKVIVRAWVSIVMIGYALVFLAIALALAFGGNDRDRGGGAMAGAILRVISEALWWTFHPFSPVARRNVYDGSWWDGPAPRRASRDDGVPFYEKVNRFVFGPEAAKPDVREMERRILAQIRSNQGRIGIHDVMQVTGLPREEADPLMARLMLDYEGEVEVSDDAAITWKFPALRKTAGAVNDRAPPPVWSTKVQAPAITGNASGTNMLVAAVNAFNLLASWMALKTNLTIDRLVDILTHAKSRVPHIPLPYDGTPWVLGVVPFVFSMLLFAMPVWRWATEASRKKAAATENGRRAVLKTVLQGVRKDASGGVREDDLQRAWKDATGESLDDQELVAQVVALGGDVDVEARAEGRGVFRFRDLEAEVLELQKQRAEASSQEQQTGAVVFRA